MNGASGQKRRAASSRCRVPKALTSKSRKGMAAARSFEVPTGIALRTEEDSAKIAVDADHAKALTGEEERHLGSDQATGSRDQDGWGGHELSIIAFRDIGKAWAGDGLRGLRG